MNRKQMAALAGLVLAGALMLGLYWHTRPQSGGGAAAFTVEVTHQDGSVNTFPYSVQAPSIGEALLEAGLIAGEEGAYGLYVLEVDGERAVYAEDGAYWAFYVNGEYATAGVDQTPPEEGGVYGFVYTAG